MFLFQGPLSLSQGVASLRAISKPPHGIDDERDEKAGSWQSFTLNGKSVPDATC